MSLCWIGIERVCLLYRQWLAGCLNSGAFTLELACWIWVAQQHLKILDMVHLGRAVRCSLPSPLLLFLLLLRGVMDDALGEGGTATMTLCLLDCRS